MNLKEEIGKYTLKEWVKIIPTFIITLDAYLRFVLAPVALFSIYSVVFLLYLNENFPLISNKIIAVVLGFNITINTAIAFMVIESILVLFFVIYTTTFPYYFKFFKWLMKLFGVEIK